MNLNALLLFGSITTLWAGVPGEVSALDSLYGGSGTRLLSMPTYIYERPAGFAGVHALDEQWTPDRSADRHLPNRYSRILNWQSGNPGLWFYTGNEIGDLLYQELLEESATSNRTPMLDGGITTPTWNNFWVTAQGSQVDHFSSATLNERTNRNGSMSFAWFGENLPAFSTAFAGGGYRNGQKSASLLAGSDYLWALTRTRRWVPVEITPRVQADASWGRASLRVAYEKQHFADQINHTEGAKEEWNSTLRWACPQACQSARITCGGGLSIRHESDSGNVPWGLSERSTVAWPWVEARIRLLPGMHLAGYGGANDQDKLVRDSLQFEHRYRAFQFKTGMLNHLGTTLDPMAYDFEAYNGDTLDLQAQGYMQLYKGYAEVRYQRSQWEWHAQGFGWREKGAETFTLHSVLSDNGVELRQGEVERVKAWLSGVGWSAGALWRYGDLFTTGATGGWEQFYGPLYRAEIKPTQGFAKISASWLLLGSLAIDHEWVYRSSASWNHEAGGVLPVPGGWTWNASLQQRFPRYHTTLQATWLHVLTEEAVLAPRGGYDRTRFYCGLRTDF
jgi:hypothetical protein